jgi:hypothetical protein
MSGYVNQDNVLLRAETEMSDRECITFVTWEVTALQFICPIVFISVHLDSIYTDQDITLILLDKVRNM